MSVFKYYIDNQEYTPINTGEFTFDYNLVTDAGAYHYPLLLNGNVMFDKSAYNYIQQHGSLQKIPFRIDETISGRGTFTIIRGYFTHYDCEFTDDLFQVSCKIRQESFYQCLVDNYDRKFNFLEVPNIVSATYETTAEFIYLIQIAGLVTPTALPLFGTPVESAPSGGPFIAFGMWARETITTYCQGGEPQKPPQGTGTPWQLELDNCAGGRVSKWSRKPEVFEGPPLLTFTAFATTICPTTPCTPPTPAVTVLDEDWVLMQTIANPTFTTAFWIDYNRIKAPDIEFNNGRLFTDVINHGLNQHCGELDLQSQFLFSDVNPVTGNSPSSTQGIQMHSIDDIKDPDATEPATVQDTTLKELLDNYVSSKLNCFWYVEENTKRLIIEHYNDLNNTSNPFDIRPYQNLNNKYAYDKTDTPKAEEFPSLDVSIDFTGINIDFDNDVASGNKAYNTDKFFSEVQFIEQDAENYPNDGIVMITPDSLAPFSSTSDINARTELGAITQTYYPNMPQGMANLQEKFWKFYRPFSVGSMNFNVSNFEKNKPVKQLQPVTVPLCDGFFFFNPRAAFIGNKFNNGQLRSASFNPKTFNITLNINYNE